jgi:uncharacterized protein with GYD domain
MTVYIVQGRYTSAALKGMVAKPEDRRAETQGLVERAGGKLLDYYITFGDYDFLLIYENPNPIAAFAGAVIGGSTGGVTDLKTTVALTSAEAKQGYELAKRDVDKFRAAGS